MPIKDIIAMVLLILLLILLVVMFIYCVVPIAKQEKELRDLQIKLLKVRTKYYEILTKDNDWYTDE